MKNPVISYEPNTEGRDFVIGDLHGALDVFQNFLCNIDFDPTVDRIFSVGDLIDRGPNSLGCLRLLTEPWFHAGLANHEDMMLTRLNSLWADHMWLRNGGAWGQELADAYRNSTAISNLSAEDQEFSDLVALVRELPYIQTVKTVSGKQFHILHAELPLNAEVTDEKLADPVSVMRLSQEASGRNGVCFLWARNLFYSFFTQDLSNLQKVKRTVAYYFKSAKNPFSDKLSHIISGHTILQRPMTIDGQTNIDTGAYLSYPDRFGSPQYKWAGLTAVNLDTWEFYHTTPTTFEVVQPVVVNRADINSINEVKPSTWDDAIEDNDAQP